MGDKNELDLFWASALVFITQFLRQKMRNINYDKMGASLRGGLDIKHFRLSIEQNFILSSSQYELNFLTLKIGITIGSRKKSIPE